MCYLEKTEYRILPLGGYRILRGCPGCGGRSVYGSTGNFRVNANGKQIDVWLIYRCEKCGYTYNLAIYERVAPKNIPGEEYTRFLENDRDAALWWGTRKEIFARNRAEIDQEGISYEIIPMENVESVRRERQEKQKAIERHGTKEDREAIEKRETMKGDKTKEGEKATEEQKAIQGQEAAKKRLIIIDNPYGLKIRVDKVAAEICHVTRSRFRQLVKEGKINLPQNYAGRRTELELAEWMEETEWTNLQK